MKGRLEIHAVEYMSLKSQILKNIRIIRGLDKTSLKNYRSLSKTDFYSAFKHKKMTVFTKEITSEEIRSDLIEDWDGFIEP